jgi:hypothetical protein
MPGWLSIAAFDPSKLLQLPVFTESLYPPAPKHSAVLPRLERQEPRASSKKHAE